MFKFIFGLVWTAFTTFMCCLFLLVPNNQGSGSSINPLVIIFLIIFEIIGLSLIISGLKKILKDSKTDKFGKKCYGVVTDILATGSYVNGNPEYKAILDFVNPDTNEKEKISEIVGFYHDKYPVGSFVLGKYYQGDINIEYSVSDTEVPSDVKDALKSSHVEVNSTNLEFNSDK